MDNFNNILNDLALELLTKGHVSFNKDGLIVESTYDGNGNLSVNIALESPEVDNLRGEFENYIKSLNDDFFLEIVEGLPEGALKSIQDMIDSSNINVVKEGIDAFMVLAKKVAKDKVNAITEDIDNLERQISDLSDIRDSYIHVLNTSF